MNVQIIKSMRIMKYNIK